VTSQLPVDDERHDHRTDSSCTPHSLLVAVRQHDVAAWHKLVHLYGPLIYQWCQQDGLQDADAADVGQEVFRAVATAIDRFRRDRPGDSFRGWLWSITRCKLADHWRVKLARPAAEGGTHAHQRLDQIAAESSSVSSASYQPAAGETERLLCRALDLVRSEFEPQTWQAFWRVAVDGRRAADVAAELNISVGSVYVAKSRILRRLRVALAGLEEF
jgi:RNA polymerase sigma-70 factor (ECF subfamily)